MSKKYNIGYPMSREVSDGTGTLYISTSEYAHFAETFIPKKGSVGTVTAILGWFHDKNDNYGGKYQLTLRSLVISKGLNINMVLVNMPKAKDLNKNKTI